jgi:hypothetical protein
VSTPFNRRPPGHSLLGGALSSQSLPSRTPAHRHSFQTTKYVPASVDKPVNIYLLRIRFWQGV